MEFARYQEILGTENAPKDLAEFQQMKYTEPEKWDAKQKSFQTLAKINGKPWTDSFKGKTVEAYWHFHQKGYELNEHSAARLVDRKDTKTRSLTYDELEEIMAKPANYVQDEDSREVRYYDGFAVITTKGTHHVITIVERKNVKSSWRKIE